MAKGSKAATQVSPKKKGGSKVVSGSSSAHKGHGTAKGKTAY